MAAAKRLFEALMVLLQGEYGAEEAKRQGNSSQGATYITVLKDSVLQRAQKNFKKFVVRLILFLV
ncbi:MAG: hypothetical protein LBQ63_07930 [Deltaproteobacteria bacterium]|nr:hypothetical protein [Deltaproteobacteria bacterium]